MTHQTYFKTPAVRSERYRRLVAALPCIHCGLHGRSQAAHPNCGKGKGKKLDDRLVFPLCADGPGYSGCHTRHDQHKLLPRGSWKETEDDWANQTILRLVRDGSWPSNLPMPGLVGQHHPRKKT